MDTKREISFIGYNSEPFMRMLFDNLIRERKINFYAYIWHMPELDERKSHWHVYMEPNSKISTDDIVDRSEEYDPTNELPLKLKDARYSKWSDWYLYAVHDSAYLASKGLSKKYHYKREDVKTSDIDVYCEKLAHMKFDLYKRQQLIIEELEKGRSVSELLRVGMIAINQYQYWCKFVESDICFGENLFYNQHGYRRGEYDGDISEVHIYTEDELDKKRLSSRLRFELEKNTLEEIKGEKLEFPF